MAGIDFVYTNVGGRFLGTARATKFAKRPDRFFQPPSRSVAHCSICEIYEWQRFCPTLASSVAVSDCDGHQPFAHSGQMKTLVIADDDSFTKTQTSERAEVLISCGDMVDKVILQFLGIRVYPVSIRG